MVLNIYEVDGSNYSICVNHNNTTLAEFTVTCNPYHDGWDGMATQDDIVFFFGKRPAEVFVQIEKYLAQKEHIETESIIRKLLKSPVKAEYGKRFARTYRRCL